MKEKIVLIDGHSILNRAFYGVPDLTNSEGIHTNAVYGFLNIMFKILEEEKPQYLAVAFDVHAPTFRHEMYPEYKGTRKATPGELIEQVPLTKEVLKAMGIPILEQAGYEADDILGTIGKKSSQRGMEVAIISGDRDLLQLAEEHIKIRIPKTRRGTTEIEDYLAEDVLKTYQVTPLEFIDVKALMGDASDNIPGVPGIGEKTATNLIVKYKSIENAYDNLDEITPKRAQTALRENYELAQMSKTLATICTECDIEFSWDKAKIEDFYTPEAYEYMKRFEFKSILTRFDKEAQTENPVEESFAFIEDFGEAERVFGELLSPEWEGITGIILIHEADTLLGISLSYGKDKNFFIAAGGFLTEDYLLQKAEDIYAHKSVKVTIDLKSQLPLIHKEEGRSVYDAGIASYLLNPLKDTYDYDDIARDYMKKTVPSRADLLGKTSLSKAKEDSRGEFLKYCCYISHICCESFPVLRKELEETGMKALYEEIEMPLIYTLHHMEELGIRVERRNLAEYSEMLGLQIDRIEKKIYETTGQTFNINSPKQLGEVLFDKLKLPHAKKTKTGYSTAADVLDKLKEEYPVVSDILEYRQLTKLKSTYADGLGNYIGEDERIHSTFNQTITATGRISSTEPNLQNIPIRMELGRAIRKVFIPEEGYIFVDADYSQIELRVLAHMSGDERLIDAYRQEDDIHRITASQVFHIPLEEVTSLQRSNAKAVNFGIVYGISAFGLSEGLSISREEAVEYIQKYFKTYPRVKLFLDELVEKAKEDGYVTTMFGRRRPVPELKSGNFMQRSFGERVAMNSPIQGTAADIIKIAMIRVDRRLREAGMKSRLILQVHDELLIETHTEEEEEVKRLLEKEMNEAAELMVPLEVDINRGSNWFETK